ncbi:suppressor of fused domain protein [Brevibacillus laterosporus]|uniref:suppressor of fused domain protein n=1 Tax=Brevibacillus laterosporus TaxID=1465 RepID=UPI000839C09C|nr:suppressor of fused domain protein [Brevibacillus laterosporus]
MFLLKIMLLMIAFLFLLFFLYLISKKKECTKQPEMLKVWLGVVEQAVSEAGSRSIQHSQKQESPDIYHDEPKNKQTDVTWQKWIKSHYQAFFHDQPIDQVSIQQETEEIAVLLYPCNRSRGWLTYATCGCAIKNGTEYIISTYEKHQELPILIEHIIQQAVEIDSSTNEQLFSSGQPFGTHHGFTHVICLPPVFEPEGFAHFTDGKELVSIYMLVPLWRTEAEFVTQNGWSELEAIFIENDVNTLEWNRASVI